MTGTEINRKVDTFGPEDMAKPELKLVQGTTTGRARDAGANPGDFFNVITGEVIKDGFEFIILDFSKTRTYWGRDVIGDEPPECASSDADSFESLDGRNCKECELRLDNAWSVNAADRRKRCTIQYGIMGMMMPDMSPFMLRATGISSSEVQKLIARFRFNKHLRNKDNPALIDWHKVQVPVKSREVKTPAGNAYALDFGSFVFLNNTELEDAALINSAMLLGQADNFTLPAPGEKALPAGETKIIDPPGKPDVRVVQGPPPEPAIPAPALSATAAATVPPAPEKPKPPARKAMDLNI